MISNLISDFVRIAIRQGLLESVDQYYVANRLLALIKEDECVPNETTELTPESSLLETMDALRQVAQAKGIVSELSYEVEQFEASVMDLVTPAPSLLNQKFWGLYKEDKELATNYFYELSQSNDYIKTRQIARNVAFKTPSAYGNLEITVNLSKPEKDPKEIAMAKNMPAASYPKCALCIENEGYKGRSNHAARQSHRLIRMDLDGETYGMQYSPYVYYNEHSIFLSEEHRPMVVDRACLEHLLAITEVLPHYFAGSNADLPIVGGSILSHDHYQGGRYEFPMDRATVNQTVSISAYPEVEVELLNWPLSVVRIRSHQKASLTNLAEQILNSWRQYSDESADILAHTGNTPHNTITPIVRRRGEQFEMDLVLRNNRTTEEYPDGLFHPHADVQHIKKENIGLIEVMGLAILPPRLLNETEIVKAYLLGETSLEVVPEIHQSWAESLRQVNEKITADNVQALIEQGIGAKFARVLEDAGVYKQTPVGQAAFLRFIEHVNQA